MRVSGCLIVGALVAVSIGGRPVYAAQYGGQATTKSSVAVDDSTLKNRVEANLKNQPVLKNQDIDVSVNNKVVTLSGTVQTAARKARADRAAHVAGVASVVNNLTVDPHAGKGLADKTGDAAKTVGTKTKDGLSATGEMITDAWLNTKVHANMMNEPLLKDSSINVDVNNHIVTLKGTVTTAAGKARAEEIARSTEGVKGVMDSLIVGPKR